MICVEASSSRERIVAPLHITRVFVGISRSGDSILDNTSVWGPQTFSQDRTSCFASLQLVKSQFRVARIIEPAFCNLARLLLLETPAKSLSLRAGEGGPGVYIGNGAVSMTLRLTNPDDRIGKISASLSELASYQQSLSPFGAVATKIGEGDAPF